MLFAGRAAAAGVDTLAEQCSHCHGENGASSEPTVPIIGGMSDFYIIDTMLVYQDEARPCVEAEYLDGPDKGQKTDMCRIAADLSEQDFEALGEYYAGKPFVAAKQEFDAAKAAEGQKVHDRQCEKCHEDGGAVAEDDAGFLAGQWTPYLKQVFEHYDSGERGMPEKMEPKYEKLDAAEKEALLHYYASLQ
jgi:sulfide dehydrogenase cytochrome subunit